MPCTCLPYYFYLSLFYLTSFLSSCHSLPIFSPLFDSILFFTATLCMYGRPTDQQGAQLADLIASENPSTQLFRTVTRYRTCYLHLTCLPCCSYLSLAFYTFLTLLTFLLLFFLSFFLCFELHVFHFLLLLPSKLIP